MITVYTDGACKGNPGKGGWAYVVPTGDTYKYNHNDAPVENTTNNIMELTAFLEGLKFIKRNGYVLGKIITDSSYVKNGITQWISGWKRNSWRTANGSPVKNKELWEAIYEIYISMDITVEWVKAHNGDKWNEVVDKLASNAATN